MEREAAAQPGFKIHRHHVRPRLEHYVDLGLLGRRAVSRGADTVYEPIQETRRAAEAWSPLLDDPKTIQRFLDTRFFESVAHVFGLAGATPCTPSEALLYFARAFELIGREIGFTPGRTVAFTACLLALEDGRLAEVNTMFDEVYASAKTEVGEHLIFSGGSRSDREFLIRVRPDIVSVLQQRVVPANATSSGGKNG